VINAMQVLAEPNPAAGKPDAGTAKAKKPDKGQGKAKLNTVPP
jgi:hypothetical protein